MTKIEYDQLMAGTMAVIPPAGQAPAAAAPPRQPAGQVPAAARQPATTDMSGMTRQLSQLTETLTGFSGIIKQLSDNQTVLAQTMANGGQPLAAIHWASDEDAALMAGLDVHQLAAIRNLFNVGNQPRINQQLSQNGGADNVRFIGIDQTPAGHQQQAKELTMQEVMACGDTISGVKSNG